MKICLIGIAILAAPILLGFFAQVVKCWIIKIVRWFEKKHLDQDDQWMYKI